MDYDIQDDRLVFDKRYIRTHPDESVQLPVPNRVVVPPPDVNYDSGSPVFIVPEAPPFDYVDDSWGSSSFMKALRSCHRLELPHQMLDWKYDSRRAATSILPFLCLGPGAAAREPLYVPKNGITFMVAVRSTATAARIPTFLSPASFSSAFGLDSITVDLDSAFELATSLRRVVKAMNDHLERSCVQQPIASVSDIRGKIFVFCESGNERSTVVVCGYLMVVYGVDPITAIHVVQSQRFCIDVKDDMKHMLFNLEVILSAERQVAAVEGIHPASASMDTQVSSLLILNKSSKRTFDRTNDDDDDDEMEDIENWHSFGNSERMGVAPFRSVGPSARG